MKGDRRIITGRYYNANWQAMAIVAVVTEGVDWAAYANGVDYSLTEPEAVRWVAEHGEKLSRDDARYYFPDIELPYRS